MCLCDLQGSYIRGTNGNSNGIVPMLRVFNDTCVAVRAGWRHLARLHAHAIIVYRGLRRCRGLARQCVMRVCARVATSAAAAAHGLIVVSSSVRNSCS